MIANTDYIALGTLITAIGTSVVGIIVAIRQTGSKAGIDAIHDAVRTSNGQTIGELVESNEVRRVDEDPSTTKHS